jgi:hypothetical protein
MLMGSADWLLAKSKSESKAYCRLAVYLDRTALSAEKNMAEFFGNRRKILCASAGQKFEILTIKLHRYFVFFSVAFCFS